jgi:hypothetical protein
MPFIRVVNSYFASYHVGSEAKADEEKVAKLAKQAKRKAEEEALAARKKLEDGTV